MSDKECDGFYRRKKVFDNKKNNMVNDVQKDIEYEKWNIRNGLLINELEKYEGYIHEFSFEYNDKKKRFLQKIESEDKKNIRKDILNVEEKHIEKKGILNEIILGINKRKYIKGVVTAAIVILILIPSTVLAAEKIIKYYNISVKKIGNYGYDISLDDECESEFNDKFHTNVKIDIESDIGNYEIKTDGSNYKLVYIGDDTSYQRDISIMLIGLNKGRNIKLKYITDINQIEYNDRKVLWFTHNYGASKSDIGNKYINDIFVVYSEYGYAIEIKAQEDVSKEILDRLIDNIRLIECDENESAKANYRIYRDENESEDNKIIEQNNIENSDIYYGEYNDTSYRLKDKFCMPYVNMYSSNKLQYTVNDYKIFDSIDSLSEFLSYYEKKYITDDSILTTFDTLKRVVDENGKFISYKRPKTYNMGDGIDTLNSSSEAEYIMTKLVLVDMDVENTTYEYIKNVRLIPQICCLYRINGKLMIPKENYSNGLVNGEGYPLCVLLDSSLGVDRTENEANRTNVEPDEKIHMTVGYLVDEDRLDNMILFYNSYGNLTYSKGKMAYISLE